MKKTEKTEKTEKTVVRKKQDEWTGLMGKKITLFCMNYVYTGTLDSRSVDTVKLTDASVVFETGAFSEKGWKDFENLPNPVYVQIRNVEAFMILK